MEKLSLKKPSKAIRWWHMSSIPVLTLEAESGGSLSACSVDQVQDSQSYIKKPYLENQNTNKQNKKEKNPKED